MKFNLNVHIVSINSISYNIPLYNYVISFFKNISNNNAEITHTEIKGLKDFRGLIKTHSILVFRNTNEYYNQSLTSKIIKHLRIHKYVIKILFQDGIKIFYSPDFEVILAILIYKTILFKHKIIIIYHQFELIEIEELSFIKKYLVKIFFSIAKYIDIILVPEINRVYYFREQTGIKDDSLLLVPNTCRVANNAFDNNNTNDLTNVKKLYKIIAHVGALSSKNFFLNEYLENLLKLNIPDLQLLFVGRTTEEAKTIINSYPTLNTKIIDYIQHDELLKLYPSIDIGVILYKGISLNLELAAPNKLYEYWSYGIPVIAPKLKGLMSLFKEDFLGDFVDFTDGQQLAGTINRLLSDSSLIKSQIQYYFEKHLSIDNYLEMFKKKIEKKVNLIQNV